MQTGVCCTSPPVAPTSSPTNKDGLDEDFEKFAAESLLNPWNAGECAEEGNLLDPPGSMIIEKEDNCVLRMPNKDMKVKGQIELNRMLCRVAAHPKAFIKLIETKRREDGFDIVDESDSEQNEMDQESDEFLHCDDFQGDEELQDLKDEGVEEQGSDNELISPGREIADEIPGVQHSAQSDESAKRRKDGLINEAELARRAHSPFARVDNNRLKQYCAKSIAGKGNFSTVYRAVRKFSTFEKDNAIPDSANTLLPESDSGHDDRDEDSNQYVALKCIKLDSLDCDLGRKKCIKEIKALQTLQHPNIISCLDTFRSDSGLFIVLEWAAAGDLKRMLNRVKAQRSRFHEKVVWTYFAQLARAVAYMHSLRMLHRDIKAANIFIMSDGRIKLGDLGLTRALSSHTIRAYSKVGTPLYMAPEVLQGTGHDFKSDVWAMGCVLYELAMLYSPFEKGCKTMRGLFARILAGEYSPLREEMEFSHAMSDLLAQVFAVYPARRPNAKMLVAFAEGQLTKYTTN